MVRCRTERAMLGGASRNQGSESGRLNFPNVHLSQHARAPLLLRCYCRESPPSQCLPSASRPPCCPAPVGTGCSEKREAAAAHTCSQHAAASHQVHELVKATKHTSHMAVGVQLDCHWCVQVWAGRRGACLSPCAHGLFIPYNSSPIPAYWPRLTGACP